MATDASLRMSANARTVVLLEGASDVAAVRALMETSGIDPRPIELLSLQGVTNVGRVLKEIRLVRSDVDVVGLCDAAETRFVERALVQDGLPVSDASDLPTYGFFVCVADLEEELIRALTPERARDTLMGAGLGGRFEALQTQAAWVDRPLAEQLHRFCGVASGRKELAAGILAGALADGEAPEPLAMLLDRLRWA
ncbi:TOPRIM nucleotidyl transferase/hydrolase domain-containing protein [Mariniluteicoccus flavus]